MYDFIDSIKQLRNNKTALFILVENNPTVLSRMTASLKGRQVFAFRPSKLDSFDNLIERMLP